MTILGGGGLRQVFMEGLWKIPLKVEQGVRGAIRKVSL